VAGSKTSDSAAAAPLRQAVHSHHTPIFAEADAVHRLCDDAVPFVFFTDKATGGSAVVLPLGRQPRV